MRRGGGSRAKIIPEELKSPDVIGYLNGLTTAGFKNFDVTATGTKKDRYQLPRSHGGRARVF
ncbi:MAG: hypothetical protein R2834_04380 [Rhodothermales bacterium]